MSQYSIDVSTSVRERFDCGSVSCHYCVDVTLPAFAPDVIRRSEYEALCARARKIALREITRAIGTDAVGEGKS